MSIMYLSKINKETEALIKLSATSSFIYASFNIMYVFSGSDYEFTCVINNSHYLLCKTIASCKFFNKEFGINFDKE